MIIKNSIKLSGSVTKISNSVSLRVFAKADEPAEIMLYDEIGKDPWTGDGVTASDFKKALDAVTPKGRQVNLRINSPGGLVSEGLAIHNLIAQYPGKVIAFIDGIAASTASFIPMACDEIHMPKTAQMFIHDAWGYCMGPASDMESAATQLNACSDQIAGMYAAKNGKTVQEMRDMMRDETLMTGQDAFDNGLVDTLTDSSPARNFTTEEIKAMKAKLRGTNPNNSATKNGAASPQPTPPNANIMDRNKMIAFLNKFKIAFQDSMTDAQLLALIEGMTPAAPATPAAQNSAGESANAAQFKAIQDQLAAMTEANNAAKKLRITNEIQTLIDNDQLPLAVKDKAILRAMADETVLDEYRAMPAKPPGTSPVSASVGEITSESPKDVCHFLLETGPRFNAKFMGRNAGNIDLGRDATGKSNLAKEIGQRALSVGGTYNQYKDKIRNQVIQAYNTNTLDAELQRTVILQEMLRAYQIPLLALKNFCTVFNSIPLEGTDKIAVPYFALQTAASTSFVAATGYTTGNTTESVRDVKVGGSGDGSTPPTGTWYDRLYQGAAFTSYEQSRQPYLNMEQLLVMNAQKLGVDVFTAIVQHVITAANFGASVKAVPAQAFSSSDVADLYGTATGLNWPTLGRSLVLNHPYNVQLLKDPAYKYALNYGATDPIRQAKIQETYGFQDINIVPNLSTYGPAGEFLQGWITHMSALLVATSPIMPAPEVLQLLGRYDVVADPSTGIAFEYRRWASLDLDTTKGLVECNFGASPGVQTALARITSQ